MNLKNEPVLILGALAAVIQVVIGLLTKNTDPSLVTGAITAIGALLARSQVSPVKP